MAKEKNLTTVTSVAAADFARLVTSAGASVKATAANLAKYIIETYNGSTVAGSAQSVKSALDSLNSKIYSYKTGVSFDTLTSTGFYYCETMTDRPSTTYSAYGVIVIATAGATVVKQIAYPMAGEGYWYMRHYSNSDWSVWKAIST